MEPKLNEMMKSIEKTGGLFYQYRPCRRDMATIYDIENIRHGTVYAQTPLNMNDPFDSMIGYSPEKIYENCIEMLMDVVKIDDANMKIIVKHMLKAKILGKVSELLVNLNEIRKHVLTRRVIMHQTNISIKEFIQQNIKLLYLKSSNPIKSIYSQEVFGVFALIACKIEKADITEKILNDLLNIDELLNQLHSKIEEIKNTEYLPQIRNLLSKLTVSCFSLSGWNNQLMWSHYANSYAGICIEYDFRKIKEFIGFIYPVEYTTQRQTLSLKDIGIEGINSDLSMNYVEPDMKAIFSYLLAKNKCWEYEKEWRIINIGEENTPKFIDLSFIKSITLGINVDPLCKCLLFDLCQEKSIECYGIEISTENFSIDRKEILRENSVFDIETETDYITMLFQQINNISERFSILAKEFTNDGANPDFKLLKPLISEVLDMITNLYFLKVSFNRLITNSKEDFSLSDATDELIDGIEQLEMLVCQIKETIETLNETTPKLYFGGVITLSDYKIVIKKLSDLTELIERYERINWR